MIKFVLLAFLVVKFDNVRADCKKSITTVSGSAAPSNVCSGDLIFEDNFDTFDLNKWDHEQTLWGGGNNEFEWYTNNRNNSFVKDGILHIKPTFVADEYGENFLTSGTIDLGKDCTNDLNDGCKRTGKPGQIVNPIKSARIRTLKSFSFKYGKVEVRAKVPTGDWLWSAIWMLPSSNKYGEWPTFGEVDILEAIGNEELIVGGNIDVGVTRMSTSLHWGPDPGQNRYLATHYESTLDEGYNKDFHRFQIEWTDNYYKFSVDDREIGRIAPPDGGFWQFGGFDGTGALNPWRKGTKMAPFDEPFHILINLAIGGNFFPEYGYNKYGDKPWKMNTPQTKAMTDFWKAKDQWKPTWHLGTDDSHFQVDYVRVWAI